MATHEIVEVSSSTRFIWKIENFSKLNTDIGGSSDDVFFIGPFKWRASICLKVNGRVDDHLSVFLVEDDLTNSTVVDFSFDLMSQTDSNNSIKFASGYACSYGPISFMRLSELHDPTKGYIVNDSCIIRGVVTFRTKETIDGTGSDDMKESQLQPQKIQNTEPEMQA